MSSPARPPRRTAVLEPVLPYTLHLGDCLDVLRTLPDASVDSVVCDPPYELGFMNRAWDASGIAFSVQVWRECLRVLKPGGHLVSFGGTRTYHRMTVAIEDAGLEIRDCLMWVYGSGFPKSKNVALSIDKGEGHPNRGRAIPTASRFQASDTEEQNLLTSNAVEAYRAKSDAARAWEGWGTALKPAWEPIVMARKPLEGTVAANVLKHGTGGLNIDGCRAGSEAVTINRWDDGAKPFGGGAGHAYTGRTVIGRWPANVIHDGSETITAFFPDAPGQLATTRADGAEMGNQIYGAMRHPTEAREPRADATTSAARFFNALPFEVEDYPPFYYVPKAPRREREAGCGEVRNSHPTVKPVTVMRHLVRLVTPPGGVVLDPFMGSGTTGIAAIREGFCFIGIEREPEYLVIAKARIEHARS